MFIDAAVVLESPAEKPVSLRPLKVEEALKDLLNVKSGKIDRTDKVRRAKRP